MHATRLEPAFRPPFQLAPFQLATLGALVALTLALPLRSAEGVVLQLVPATPTANTFDLAVIIASLGTDTDTSVATGDMEVDFQYSFVGADAVITGIDFTGGEIDFSDVNFDFPPLLQINGTDISGTLETLQPPSPVTGGQFDASESRMLLDQGQYVISGLSNQTIDLTVTPVWGLGTGNGSVVTTETARSALSVTYDTTVIFPINRFIRFQDTANGDPLTLDAEFIGNFEATGSWTVALPPAGDYNGDGAVDAADYTVWRDTQNQTGAGLAADGNNDGTVDALDYSVWASNFGQPAPTASNAVPEPGALVLIVAGGFSLLLGRARNR